MAKYNGAELFPIVNEKGDVIGSASRKECHSGTKKLHPVVHLHVFDSEGRLFLPQIRNRPHKMTQRSKR